MVRENIMKWSTPTLSDEEAYSVRLPSSFKCDGCTAIAFQISTGMAVFHEKKYRKKKKMAPESEVIELIENICDKKTFENYGLKQMGGINRLSGPGTEAEEEPGMMQGGGKWPNRLAMMCGEIAGELDEYDMYKAVVEDGPEKLFQLICQDNENSVLAGCMEKQMKDEL
ncbi:MZB1 [Bugula neritina]|uniref:MZB1 n=1 Tax=Bugula neritina TaxID=10212 RepID=A0A7J7IVU8_BUGNE|nr:MZB1 [Bugula neritina]